MDVNLVCPNCRAQSTHTIEDIGWASCTCPKCQREYKTLIASVRSKRSRGSRKAGSREFDVRVYVSENQEELIQFVAPGYDDFELRSSDMAAFSYLNGTLYIVQNFTIGQYKVVRRPGRPVLVWILIAVGIVIAIALLSR